MTFIYNKTSEKEKRKILRNNTPKAEVVLWSRLQRKQLDGYKFRRQHSIGKFVVDFYCPQLKLVIEVDGGSHFVNAEAQKYDREREIFIESLGIKFLRFLNTEIYGNIEGVLEKILREFNRPLTTPRPSLLRRGLKGGLLINQSGFTLVEFILYAALAGILLTAGAIFASDVVLGSVKARVKAKVQNEARFALEKMRQEIVKGKNIILPVQGNSGNNFQLEIPGSPSTLACVQVNNNILQFSTGGTITPVACSSSWQNLTSGEVEVMALNFQNISSGTSLGEEAVKINLSLKNKNPGGKKEFDAETTMSTSISLRL